MTLRVKPRPALAVVVASATTLAVPALSSGHATISPLQPQGAPLTAARGTYVVRAPNEREKQSTWKIGMYVPGPFRRASPCASRPTGRSASFAA